MMPGQLLRIRGRGSRVKASFPNSPRGAGAVPSSTIFFPRGGAPCERNQACGQGGSGRSLGANGWTVTPTKLERP
jgi:hypothetical protein